MKQIALRAVFMRGGTSKAVMFRAEDLPHDRAQWAPIFLGVIGSPDANGRQLDGMGGGRLVALKSVRGRRSDASRRRRRLHLCSGFGDRAPRSITAAIAAICRRRWARSPSMKDSSRPPAPKPIVRIHNTNTRKIIVAHFRAGGRPAPPSMAISRCPAWLARALRCAWNFSIPAEPEPAVCCRPAMSWTELEVAGVGAVEASMIDAANPWFSLRLRRSA